MTVGPNTTFTLGGDKNKEDVFLDEGKLGVIVKKNRGSFDVVVDEAVVHVTGTQFDVDVSRVLNEKDAQYQKKMRVAVQEGSVDVSIDGGKEKKTLHKDESWEVTVSSTALQRQQVQAEIDPSSPDAASEIPQDLDLASATSPDVPAALEMRNEEPKAPPSEEGGRLNTGPLVPSSTSAALNANGARGREPNAAAGRGVGARGPLIRPRPNMDPKFVPLVAVAGTGVFSGQFQKVGNYYVLNTGRVLLLVATGVDDLPRGAPNPGPNSRAQVRFLSGKVTSIVALPTTRPGAEKFLNKNK